MYVSLVLALERLAKAACDKSRETKEKVITEQHIKLVFRVSVYMYCMYIQFVFMYVHRM